MPPKITIVVELEAGHAAETLELILREARELDEAAISRKTGAEWIHDMLAASGRLPAPPLVPDMAVRGRVAMGVRAVLNTWHANPRNRVRDEMISDLVEAVMFQLSRDDRGG